MLTTVITVLGLPPTCSISANSLPSVNALRHLQMADSCKVSFWKASFNRVTVPTLIFFLISHKILQRNIIWSKHPFPYLHWDSLHGNTYYFHMLTSRVFFIIKNEADTFPLILPMLPNIESFHFSVHFLHLSFSIWYTKLFSPSQL